MGSSSAKLREYLASDECALQSLVLARADVDDWECADFMARISASRRVETPSLHSNDSFPSHDDVGGLISDFEAVRIESMLRAGTEV